MTVRQLAPLTGRVHSSPWYRNPLVIGGSEADEPEFVYTDADGAKHRHRIFALIRRDEMFMPEAEVVAYLVLAIESGQQIRLNWLQPYSDPDLVVGRPHQRFAKVNVAAIFLATRSFVVADPETSQIFQVSFDAVIDIGYVL